MYWYPAEILELTRWSDLEDTSRKPVRTGLSGHWVRAFSCAALLRATCEPYNYYGDGATDSSLINLILSLRVLPFDFSPQAVKFLAWLLLHSEPEGQDKQVCAYGIGLFWFTLQLATPDEPLISLAQWIVRRAKKLYAELLLEDSPLPLRMGVGNPPPSPWEHLGIAFLDLDLKGRSRELLEWVEQIGLELAR